MSVRYRNKNNFNGNNTYSRLSSLLFLTLSLFIIGLVIKVNNESEVMRRDKIPLVIKQIKSKKDQKVIAINNRDRLLRTHIKSEAKKNGMIKADYIRNIIKW